MDDVVFRPNRIPLKERLNIPHPKKTILKKCKPETALNEISVLQHLQKNNMLIGFSVRLIDCFRQSTNPDDIYILTEYGGRSLTDYLSKKRNANRLDSTFVLSITHSLLEATLNIHELGIAHLNLTPSNILVSGSIDAPSPTLKLCDFEIALQLPKEQLLGFGTIGYMSPDFFYLSLNTITELSTLSPYLCDSWSLGCICLSLILHDSFQTEWMAIYNQVSELVKNNNTEILDDNIIYKNDFFVKQIFLQSINRCLDLVYESHLFEDEMARKYTDLLSDMLQVFKSRRSDLFTLINKYHALFQNYSEEGLTSSEFEKIIASVDKNIRNVYNRIHNSSGRIMPIT